MKIYYSNWPFKIGKYASLCGPEKEKYQFRNILIRCFWSSGICLPQWLGTSQALNSERSASHLVQTRLKRQSVLHKDLSPCISCNFLNDLLDSNWKPYVCLWTKSLFYFAFKLKAVLNVQWKFRNLVNKREANFCLELKLKVNHLLKNYSIQGNQSWNLGHKSNICINLSITPILLVSLQIKIFHIKARI